MVVQLTPSTSSLVNPQPCLLQELDFNPLVSVLQATSTGLAEITICQSPSPGKLVLISYHRNHFSEKDIVICIVGLTSHQLFPQ